MLKTNRNKRNLFFLLSIFSSVVAPSLAVFLKYDLFPKVLKAPTETLILWVSCLLIGMAVLFNLKRIKGFLKAPPFSFLKCIINGAIKSIPLLAIFLLLYYIDGYILNFKFVYNWFFVCNMISIFAFDPLYKYYTNEYQYDYDVYQRKKRKDLE